MKLSYAASAFLAPAIVRAAAFAMPEPTQHFAVAADNWSPAPTLAPQFNIFGRDALQANDGNTCGYVSGLSASSITCGVSSLCATNTFYGVHSCCPGPTDNLGSCTIPTTCIAATAMSSLCTDDTCSSNNAIAKCTASTAAECYKYLFIYDTTTMTQHGCTATGTTLTIPRSYGASTSVKVVTVTETPSPATTPTSSSSSPGAGSGGEKKQSLGPIVGGTIGACTIISIVALTAFLIHRRRVKARSSAPHSPPPPVSQFSHNTPQFDPRGFPANTSAWTEQDIKTWQQSGGVWRPGMSTNGMGMGMGMVGVSEVHGEDRAVEVEAREKIKHGQWQGPGVGAVEVEAPLKREREREREEKKWSWRGPVEAPS